MAVLTHARNPATTTAPAPAEAAPAPATAALVDHIYLHALGPEQRDLIRDVLWDLGIDDGHAANDGGNRDASWRLLRSAAAAAAIGLRLPASQEIAECATCQAILPAARTREHDGVLRCTVPDPDGTTCLGIYLGTQ